MRGPQNTTEHRRRNFSLGLGSAVSRGPLKEAFSRGRGNPSAVPCGVLLRPSALVLWGEEAGRGMRGI